jgi:hypothetical protein
MADEALRCCPQCGSAAVTFGVLDQSNGSCGSCGWEGASRELLVIPTSGIDQDLQLATLMVDIRSLISKDLGPKMLAFLMKWGFVEADPYDVAGTLDRRVFSRYLASMAAALLKAVLETRHEIATKREVKN